MFASITKQKATFFKIIQLIIAHLVLIMIFLIGYEQALALFQELTNYVSNSSKDILTSVQQLYTQFASLETYILFGGFFVAGLLAYDIVCVGKWLNSFSFSKNKCCDACQRKLVREPRQPIDRFLSYIVLIKRYRCIACNKEYLVVDNGSKSRKKSLRSKNALKHSRVKSDN